MRSGEIGAKSENLLKQKDDHRMVGLLLLLLPAGAFSLNCEDSTKTLWYKSRKQKRKIYRTTKKTSEIVSKCQNETNANYVIADITLKFRMNSLHLFYN